MHEAYRAPTAAAPSRRRARRGRVILRRVLVCAFLAAAVQACNSDGSGPAGETTIERAVFIDAYVALRAAAMRTDSQRISEEARVEILARHGITDADLLDFAEVNAGRLEFMRDVWNDVEVRLDGEAMAEEVR